MRARCPGTLEAQSFHLVCGLPFVGCRIWADGDGRASGRPVMTPLQTKIVHALRKRVDLRNRVTVLYEEIAGELGVSTLDVREALIDLNDDGFFPGKPSFSTEQFRAHLPA
ncbi:MAG: hypothetical protein ACLP1X_25040 [Polyangiaceae bacterium]